MILSLCTKEILLVIDSLNTNLEMIFRGGRIMLRWNRVTNQFEWERCHLTGEYITFGEYYLKDDEDGLIVRGSVYARLKRQHKEDTWDYSKLQQAQNEREYTQMMRQAEQEFLTDGLFERKIEKGGFACP